MKPSLSRRDLLRTASMTALASAGGYHAAWGDAAADQSVIGSGDFQYRWTEPFQLPDGQTWQFTHNVAVGSDGVVYVMREGRLPGEDSVFAFSPDGEFLRSFGGRYQLGGHGIEVRTEGGEDFLYVTAYHRQRSFGKLTTTGEEVWHRTAPMQAGGYADGEDIVPRENNPWARDRFLPTNFAFRPDGGFYLADGYGSFRIHRYDADANYLSTFGTRGEEPGQFNLPHGVWWDDREEEARLVIADRSNGRLQWFTPEGEFLFLKDGYSLPCHFDIRDDVMIVPEYAGALSFLGRDNERLARLGDFKPNGTPRRTAKTDDPTTWEFGHFLSPHDACFDAAGNILVTERVEAGRVIRLEKV